VTIGRRRPRDSGAAAPTECNMTMYVQTLWRYPVKSMAGERIESAVIGELGVPGDRGLVVIDNQNRILTARTKPALLRHRATLGAGGRVQVDGLDWASDDVAERVRAAAGPTARLVEVPDARRFDVLPLLVTSDGALAAFEEDPRRLRPNAVIGGVAGLAEREWEGRYLAIGRAVIGLANLRERCIMTTWDPETGAQDVEVLKRIRREFDGTFALNAWTARPGRIAQGDAVELLDSFDAPAAAHPGRYA